ncbi:fructosamine kinase family protein [Sphingosinicella sp. YJ22]|uniref:fructosamine kinase family protein n=1 Tax=Sphingosinicella sp. YJ22 TaxID=1104780 RepID=UPI0014095142|nr:fructosamine kinase family protein [Sphingosinicella sp. YJ22]
MLTGVAPERIQRLYGGDLSEVLLLHRDGGQAVVAKGGPAAGTEAQMLRELAAAGVPVPAVEAEYGDVLLIEYVDADEAFTPRAWADIGARTRALHNHLGESYGWPVDYAFGSVRLDNNPVEDWPRFWGEQRLVETAALLDRPWRERVERLAARITDLLPARPPASLLHGDLWAGNMLVRDGRLAAFIDPACYHGHAEVDLAMICLFGRPDPAFWEAYGDLEPGWGERRALYQLFPALVHLRLFGVSYASLVDRLLTAAGA